MPRGALPAGLQPGHSPEPADRSLDLLALFLDDDMLKALGLPLYPTALPADQTKIAKQSDLFPTPTLMLFTSLAALLLVSRSRRQFD